MGKDPMTAGLRAASQLRHSTAAREHVLLALLEGSRGSPARQALDSLGIGYEHVLATIQQRQPNALTDDEHFGGATSRSSWHDVAGLAHGLALGAGLSIPSDEHVLLAVLWRDDEAIDAALATAGVNRYGVRRALADLGVAVPPDPSGTGVEAIRRAAEMQAISTGHPFIGSDHLVLALLSGQPDDVAGEAMRSCGANYTKARARALESCAKSSPPCTHEPTATSARPNPRLAEILGCAEGLAGAKGTLPTSAHALVALLYEEDGVGNMSVEHLCRVTAPAVVAALANAGIQVPLSPPPEPDRRPWGERILVPPDRLKDVVKALSHELQPGRWGFNTYGGEAWVVAHAEIDLEPIVERALAG